MLETMFPRLLFSLLAVFALMFVAAAKKKPAAALRFHLQANPHDGSTFAMAIPSGNSGAPAFVKKVPEISEHQIEAIFPFTAPDGTFGCSVKLDRHGKLALDTFSVEERGRVLVCFFNLRLVTAMMIDKRVSDGIITVPAGLTPEEIGLLEANYRIMGQPATRKQRR